MIQTHFISAICTPLTADESLHREGLEMHLDDQWRAFIEDRFTQYLDKERQLEGVVNEVVTAFGDKAAALTKTLSDTLLAAIAALIGSAIAAAFKTPFNAASWSRRL